MIGLAVLMVVAQGPATAWEMKLPYEEGKKYLFQTELKVNMFGSNLDVSYIAELNVKSKSEKGLKGTMLWRNLMVDGEQVGEDLDIPAELNQRGYLVDAQSEWGEDFRRMASVFFFIYPEKPVEIGSKWTYGFKLDQKSEKDYYTADFEVKSREKIGDKEVLKISIAGKETRSDAMKVDGFFWVSRTGTVEEIELSIKQWPIAPAGTVADATLTAVNISK